MLIRCTRSRWAHLLSPRDLGSWPIPSLKTDAFTMASLRGVLREAWPAEDVTRLSDDAVLQTLERLLEVGELTVEIIADPKRDGAGGIQAPAEAPASPGPARQQAAPVEQVEADTFSPAHDGAMQAALLTAAASVGVPFCDT